jgi:hypothetical protein
MTTTEKTREEEFIERIERLDTGELAMLRRGCGERERPCAPPIGASRRDA